MADNVLQLAADEKRLNSSGLDLVVLNAAVKLPKREVTNAGIERMLAVNHLGHYLLARQLEPLMASKSRVLAITCQEAYNSQLDWRNINYDRDFDWAKAYGASKLANLLFVKEFASKMAGENFHPLSNSL